MQPACNRMQTACNPMYPRLEMSLAIGKQPPLAPLQIELYGGLAPKAAANFAQLCSGEAGTNARGVRLHFVGTALHRVIPGFMAQGGDVQHGQGGFGESVWGGAFEDEGFALAHDARGACTLLCTCHVMSLGCMLQHAHAVHALCTRHAAMHTPCCHAHAMPMPRTWCAYDMPRPCIRHAGVLSMANTGKDSNRAQVCTPRAPRVRTARAPHAHCVRTACAPHAHCVRA